MIDLTCLANCILKPGGINQARRANSRGNPSEASDVIDGRRLLAGGGIVQLVGSIGGLGANKSRKVRASCILGHD
jgi:hypothetical protein